MPRTSRLQKSPQTVKSSRVSLYWILAGSALLYVLLNPQYRTGVLNDDAVYVLGARSFWKSSAVQSLILKPDYPMPGLPVVLAPFIKLVEPNWTALEWIPILASVLSVFLLWKWASRTVSPMQALVAVCLFAFNPLVSAYSGIVMPPVFYTAAALTSFLLMSTLLEKFDARQALALGLIMGWGCLVRPEGVLLLVCVSVPLALRKSGRKNLFVAALPVAFWAGLYLFWWRLHPVPRTEYGGDLSALTSYWTESPMSGIRFFDDMLEAFLFKPLSGLWKSPTHGLFSLETGVDVLCVITIAAGYFSLWSNKRRPRPELTSIAGFCILYFLVHLFWHVADARYAVPLLPFAIVFLVHGFSEFLKTQTKKWLWIPLALGVPIASYAYQTGLNIHESLWAPNPMNSPPWESITWVKENIPSDKKIMSDIAPNIELYANRPSLMGLRATNHDMFLYRLALNHYDYVVDRDLNFLTPGVSKTEDPNRIWDRMRVWFENYPRQFQVLYENAQEQTRIYHVVPDPGFMDAYEIFKQASAQYQAGHMDLSEELIRKALRLCPNFGSASNLLGAVEMKKNDVVHAERDFLASTTSLPFYPSALLNLATLYKMTGQDERAQVYIQRATDAGCAIGQPKRTARKIQELYQLWAQHKAPFYLDVP